MDVLIWMGEHPILTVILAFIAGETIIQVAQIICRPFHSQYSS